MKRNRKFNNRDAPCEERAQCEKSEGGRKRTRGDIVRRFFSARPIAASSMEKRDRDARPRSRHDRASERCREPRDGASHTRLGERRGGVY